MVGVIALGGGLGTVVGVGINLGVVVGVEDLVVGVRPGGTVLELLDPSCAFNSAIL